MTSLASAPTAAAPAPSSGRWSLAIHGGAGAISREFDPERREYLAALRRSLDAGSAILAAGGTAVDATVAAVTQLENEVLFNAGVGSVLTVDGRHELDAGVMRGSDAQAGAVAGLQHVEHPVQLAKLVMERSPHVLLVGAGAEAFARSQGVPMVDNAMFTTPARLQIHHDLLENARKMQAAQSAAAKAGAPATSDVVSASAAGWAPTASPAPLLSMAGLRPVLDHGSEGGSRSSSSSLSASPPAANAEALELAAAAAKLTPTTKSPDIAAACNASASTVEEAGAASEAARSAGTLAERKYGTVGAVALDVHGELSCAISTGGMSLKAFGRVGDTPVIGAGFYATPRVAVACTGNGEAFLRAAVAKDVACLMEYRSLSLEEATQQAMRNGERLCGLQEFEGGLIAVDAQGHISMPFNSKGMYRATINSNTKDQEPHVAVWRD